MSPPMWAARGVLATPRGASARIALHAGAVAHQREIPALAAGFALVALSLCLGALLGCRVLGDCLGFSPGLKRGCRRDFRLWLNLQRGCARDIERGDVGHPTPAFGRPSPCRGG